MIIDRQELDQALLKFALQGHGVVIGAPGVGKSHSLKKLARQLRANSQPFIFIAVEALAEATEADLQAVLGYEGGFRDAMTQVFSRGPAGGVVIFDGYDATRSPETRERLTERVRQIIAWAPPGWNALVSVRTYDARKSPKLLGLFGARNPEEANAFIMSDVPVRHFHIPELTDAEVDSALASMPHAEAVVDCTRVVVRQLLKRPFNLWLLGYIAEASPQAIDSPVRSEIELLGRYWYTQVGSKEDEAARIAVLTSLTRHLVETRRLQVPLSDVFNSSLDGAWKGLQRDEVIARPSEALATPGTPETVGFHHNILFDYSVAILAIGNSAEEVRQFLAIDPHRSLFLRPSLTYYFDALWFRDRQLFWGIFWQLLPLDDVPTRLVVRLLPPAVIATNARSLDDLEPLLKQVRDGGDWGAASVNRVLSALQMQATLDASIWAQFAQAATSCFEPTFAWTLATLLERLVQQQSLAPADAQRVGSASRALVTISLDRGDGGERWYESFGSGSVLKTALQCADSDVPATVALVDRICAQVGTPGFPIRYFYTLCGTVSDLAAIIPDSVVKVYHAAYAHQETSNEVTRMGGIVLPMTSNRRQDFEMCRYALSRSFSKLLEEHPTHAVAACVGALQRVAEGERLRHAGGSDRDGEEEATTFRGIRRPFVDSGHFFSLEYRYSELQEMRRAVRKMAVAASSTDADSIVDVFAKEAGGSVVWELLLEIGAAAPISYRSLVHELVLSPVVLSSYGLHDTLGAFVAAAYPLWTPSEREAFERSVLVLLAEVEDDPENTSQSGRLKWLLSLSGGSAVVTEEALEVVQGASEEELAKWPRGRARVAVRSEAYTHEVWLGEQGVQTHAPANERVLKLRREWDLLSTRLRNGMAEGERVDTLVPVLVQGYDALADTDGVDPLVEEGAWTALAGIAMAVARELPPPDSSPRQAASAVLRRAGEYPPPAVGPGRDSEYRVASWSPSPRTEAIAGWSFLMRKQLAEDGTRFLKLAALSPEPSERFLVALYSPQYAESCPEVYWDIVHTLAATERNPEVGLATLGSLARWGTAGEDLRRPLARTLIERFVWGDEERVARDLGGWLVHYALFLEEDWAKAILRGVTDGFPERLQLLTSTLSAAMRWVADEGPLTREATDTATRCRAWVLSVIELAGSASVDERSANLSLRPGEERARASTDGYCRVIDDLTLDVWRRVARDAEDADDEEEEGESVVRDKDDVRRARYTMLAPIVEGLLRAAEQENGIGIVAPTAFRLVEIAKSLLPANPRAAVELAARVARASREHSFQHDSMAVKEALEIVEVALADHKAEMAVPPSREYLLELLDVFADAGWPEANRMVWRLEEVYR